MKEGKIETHSTSANVTYKYNDGLVSFYLDGKQVIFQVVDDSEEGVAAAIYDFVKVFNAGFDYNNQL